MASGGQKMVHYLAEEIAKVFLQESQAPLPNLPLKINIEILSRLPVSSLLRFRCVSKSWLALISHPHFIRAQIEHSKKKNGFTRHDSLALIALFAGRAKLCSLHSIDYEKSSVNVATSTFWSNFPGKNPRFLGSCEGLICSSSSNCTLTLWNPSTRKSKEFPDSFIQAKSGCFIRHGFGHDEATNDYKVVKIFSFAESGGTYENIVKAYSLRADSWTTIPGFSSGYIYAKTGVFVNGCLHWEIRDKNSSNVSWEIVALDLGRQTYRAIALPGSENGNFFWSLGVLNGCLVASCNYHPKMNVWVMKEYGVEESWTNVVSISLPRDHRGYVSPLCMSENGDVVLLKLGADLVVYSRRDGSFKKVEISSSNLLCLELQAATYNESLASLEVGGFTHV